MLARLCYASIRSGSPESLLEDIFDIITTARNFNVEHGICGVLYYADNAFFQCLEGNKSEVEKLFEKIKLDSRHVSIKHYTTTEIDKITFKNWTMKYVRKSSMIDDFIKNKGCEKFDPHVLEQHDLPDFINNLFLAHEYENAPRKKIGFSNRGINPLA